MLGHLAASASTSTLQTLPQPPPVVVFSTGSGHPQTVSAASDKMPRLELGVETQGTG